MHNKLVIKKAGEEFVCFNSMLSPLCDEIAGLRPYASFLAIGSGGSETTPEMVRLEKHLLSLPLETSSFNFDISQGDLYLTKKMVLGKDNLSSIEIVEVGLTSDGKGDNPLVVNRFLVNGGEPIYRDAGEDMELEVTIYFEKNEAGMLKLTSGENSLVRLLLGDKFENSPKIYFAKGDNDAPSSACIDRNDFVGEKFLAEISASVSEAGEVALRFQASLGRGTFPELLMLVDDNVCLRMVVSEHFGLMGAGSTITKVADRDISVSIEIGGTAEVDEVFDETSGAVVDSYFKGYFGTAFGELVLDPFQGKSYSSKLKRDVSQARDRICFYDYDSNFIEVYALDGSSVQQKDSTGISLEGGYLLKIYKDIVVIKKVVNNSETISLYEFVDGNYISRSFLVSISGYASCKTNAKWWDMDIASSIRGDDYFVFFCVGETNSLVHRVSQRTTGEFESKSHRAVMYGSTVSAFLLDKSNRENTLALGLCQTNRLFRADLASGNMSISTSSIIQKLKAECDEGFPRGGKNYFYYCNSKTGILTCFDPLTSTFYETLFDDVKKFYTAFNLDYLAVQHSDDSFDFYYLDGDLNLFPFSTPLPSLIDQKNVVDLEFTKGGVLFFMADGSNALVTIKENNLILSGFTAGNSITITMKENTTPGIDGAPVNVDATLLIK